VRFWPGCRCCAFAPCSVCPGGLPLSFFITTVRTAGTTCLDGISVEVTNTGPGQWAGGPVPISINCPGGFGTEGATYAARAVVTCLSDPVRLQVDFFIQRNGADCIAHINTISPAGFDCGAVSGETSAHGWGTATGASSTCNDWAFRLGATDGAVYKLVISP
jgi:hypothetical protein